MHCHSVASTRQLFKGFARTVLEPRRVTLFFMTLPEPLRNKKYPISLEKSIRNEKMMMAKLIINDLWGKPMKTSPMPKCRETKGNEGERFSNRISKMQTFTDLYNYLTSSAIFYIFPIQNKWLKCKKWHKCESVPLRMANNLNLLTKLSHQTGFHRTKNILMELLEKLKAIMNEYKSSERRLLWLAR